MAQGAGTADGVVVDWRDGLDVPPASIDRRRDVVAGGDRRVTIRAYPMSAVCVESADVPIAPVEMRLAIRMCRLDSIRLPG